MTKGYFVIKERKVNGYKILEKGDYIIEETDDSLYINRPEYVNMKNRFLNDIKELEKKLKEQQ